MTEPIEITAEMVMAVAAYSAEVAERIAAYATHRFAGLYVVDACRAAGCTQGAGRGYERAMPLLRAHFDLPEPLRGGVTKVETFNLSNRRLG